MYIIILGALFGGLCEYSSCKEYPTGDAKQTTENSGS